MSNSSPNSISFKLKNQSKLISSLFASVENDLLKQFQPITNICFRTFQATFVIISVADVNMIRYIENNQTEVEEVNRITSNYFNILKLCNEDIYIINHEDNQSNLPIFENLVIATAPIKLKDKTAGFLSIFGNRWKMDMNRTNQVILMEMSMILSDTIERRRRDFFKLETELAKLTMSIVFSLKYPLKTMCTLRKTIEPKFLYSESEYSVEELLIDCKAFSCGIVDMMKYQETMLKFASPHYMDPNVVKDIESTRSLSSEINKSHKKNMVGILETFGQQLEKLTDHVIVKVTNEIQPKDSVMLDMESLMVMFRCMIDYLATKWQDISVHISLSDGSKQKPHPVSCYNPVNTGELILIVHVSNPCIQEVNPFPNRRRLPEVKFMDNIVFQSILKYNHGSYKQNINPMDCKNFTEFESHCISIPFHVSRYADRKSFRIKPSKSVIRTESFRLSEINEVISQRSYNSKNSNEMLEFSNLDVTENFQETHMWGGNMFNMLFGPLLRSNQKRYTSKKKDKFTRKSITFPQRKPFNDHFISTNWNRRAKVTVAD